MCEAKVRASGLFAAGDNSDAAHLRALLGDQGRCREFGERVVRLLRAMDVSIAEDPVAVGVLIAGSRFSSPQIELARGMACVEVDPNGLVKAVANSHLLPSSCLAALA
jgi:hypothetical protein